MLKQLINPFQRKKKDDYVIIKPNDAVGKEYVESLEKEINDFLETFPKFKQLRITIKFLGYPEVINYENEKIPDESGEVTIGNGVYNEQMEIDLRNISSITHEFGHLVDDYSINLGNNELWSTRTDFAILHHIYSKEIDKQIKEEFKDDPHYEYKRNMIRDYACESFEVYARLFQQYYLDVYGETQLTRMKEPLDIEDKTARTVYQEHKELIGNYFDDVYYNVQFEPNLLDLNEQLGRSL